jgi:protease II
MSYGRSGGRDERPFVLATVKSETKDSPESKDKLRFEVNNHSYMLSFNSEDGRWYLVTAGTGGRMKAIPVINDDELGFVPTMVVPVGDGGQASIN